MVKEIARNIKKDIRIELRDRFAFNISVAFAAITTISVSLVTSGVRLSPRTHAVLLWVIIFFSAMNALSHIFVREIDRGTDTFLTLHSSPDTIYISKLIFNAVFFLLVLAVIVPLYLFFLDVDIARPGYFLLVLGAGAAGIVSATTIFAAMVARAGGKGSLFTVISFPVLLPVLWVSIDATVRAFDRGGAPSQGSLFFLLAFSGMILALSFLLFRFIWHE